MRLRFARATKLLNQIEACQRNVQLRFAGVLQQHEVALLIALCNFANADKLPDAVRGVDDELSWLQVGDISRKYCELALGGLTADQVRGFKQILRSKNGELRIGQHEAAAYTAFDQMRIRNCAGMIGTVYQSG